MDDTRLRQIQIFKDLNKEKCVLVQKAEDLIEESQIWNYMEESQLRNIINVANSELCVHVVTNFIRYQIGRHMQWREKEFGENVIKEVNELEKIAKRIDKENIEEAWIKLVRLLLGYMRRYFRYKKKQ